MKFPTTVLLGFILSISNLWGQACGDDQPIDSDFSQRTLVESNDYIMEIAIAKDGTQCQG